MYSAGSGVGKDYRRAVEWYRKAAEQGSPSAQFNLALMYADGLGVLRNHDAAVKWMRNAATAQSPTQQLNPMSAVEAAELQKKARQWLESFDKRRR
jgi:uncharacterized protein